MLRFDERVLRLDAAGASLLGVLHLPVEEAERGVLIVPGAPQYRVGPHRLFVDMARHLADAGYAVLRMDRRGFGDNDADPAGFEDAAADIEAGVAALRHAEPGLRGVTVLGLCDGASAALLHAGRAAGVDGLVLINPWARGEATDPRAVLGGYYLPRMLRWRRWLAAVGSWARFRGALGGLARTVLDALRASTVDPARPDFAMTMLRRWVDFPGRSLVILSGRDLTAREFDGLVRTTLSWPVLVRSTAVTVAEFPDADHTFTARRDRAGLMQALVEWLDDT
jgi:exosortase A-associated hydrolase 1